MGGRIIGARSRSVRCDTGVRRKPMIFSVLLCDLRILRTDALYIGHVWDIQLPRLAV